MSLAICSSPVSCVEPDIFFIGFDQFFHANWPLLSIIFHCHIRTELFGDARLLFELLNTFGLKYASDENAKAFLGAKLAGGWLPLAQWLTAVPTNDSGVTHREFPY